MYSNSKKIFSCLYKTGSMIIIMLVFSASTCNHNIQLSADSSLGTCEKAKLLGACQKSHLGETSKMDLQKSCQEARAVCNQEDFALLDAQMDCLLAICQSAKIAEDFDRRAGECQPRASFSKACLEELVK